MAQDHIRRQHQQNEGNADAASSQPWDKVHTFRIIASLCIGNWILQCWHSQTYADALIGCSALITGRRGRSMHENEVFVAEVLGEWVFQQQSPASGSRHLSKHPTSPDTEAKKPAGYLAVRRWAQRNTGSSSTQLIPSGQSSIILGEMRGRWGSSKLKLQSQTTTLVSPLGTCCQVLVCTTPSSVCMHGFYHLPLQNKEPPWHLVFTAASDKLNPGKIESWLWKRRTLPSEKTFWPPLWHPANSAGGSGNG